MPTSAHVDRDSDSRRTPSGDVILGSATRPGRSRDPGERRGRVLRQVAVVLGVLAVLAAVATGLAAATRSGGPSAAGPQAPGPASGAVSGSASGSAPTAPSPGTSRVPATPSSPASPYPEPTDADPAGGITAARSRVARFVAALNEGDMDAANALLCRSMYGRYSASSLAGIKPGSLGVGGVTVQGSYGSAIVTYLPEGGGAQERSMFGLTVEHDAWMVCTPQ